MFSWNMHLSKGIQSMFIQDCVLWVIKHESLTSTLFSIIQVKAMMTKQNTPRKAVVYLSNFMWFRRLPPAFPVIWYFLNLSYWYVEVTDHRRFFISPGRKCFTKTTSVFCFAFALSHKKSRLEVMLSLTTLCLAPVIFCANYRHNLWHILSLTQNKHFLW